MLIKKLESLWMMFLAGNLMVALLALHQVYLGDVGLLKTGIFVLVSLAPAYVIIAFIELAFGARISSIIYMGLLGLATALGTFLNLHLLNGMEFPFWALPAGCTLGFLMGCFVQKVIEYGQEL